MKLSKIHSVIEGRNVRPLVMDAKQIAAMTMDDVNALAQIGINVNPIGGNLSAMFRDMGVEGMAMDDTQGLVTVASVATPVQFLQAWLPGLVRVLTQARKADDLMGVMTAGAWEDEEVVQTVMEPTGSAVLYGDYTNVPLASWNPSYERRTVLRWEQGFQVGLLEDARAARARINSAAEKRNAAALSLDIIRNSVGFLGFNGGNNRTYGFLNDPSLSAYVNVAGGTWATKTYLQITADIRAAMAALQLAGKGLIDVKKTPIVLAVALSTDQYLTVTSDFGNSVNEWIKTTYPNVRVEAVPELDAANGGANVFYLYAESVPDSGTDGGQTWAQIVPAKFQALGTEKRVKGYVEDFSNALAGVMLKRPFAVVRRSGI